MAMDQDAAFAVIQRALDDFNADIGRARDEQAESEQTVAAVEYELAQLKKLIAENALSPPAPVSAAPIASGFEIPREDVVGGLQGRLGRAA